jgi:hypothetical protein
MTETSRTNLEIANELNRLKPREQSVTSSRLRRLLEVLEALLLAMVAISTAWSGYQAARWDGVQSQCYGRSSRLRVEGQALDLQANQEKMYDALTVNEWLKAEAHGETATADLFARRLLPEFRPAFEAWKETDPVHNPKAPAGPMAMPEFKNAKTDEAISKNREATDLFEQGTRARERGDDYVRVTVFLPTVLLLTAISQRFRLVPARAVLAAIAFLMLCIPIWLIFTLPRT